MKAREICMRCVKARIVSWLNTSTCGAVIPTTEGNGIVLAVYRNGRYVEPDMIHVPNSPAEMWGPDGPIYRSQPEDKPEEGPEEAPPGDQE